MTPPVDLEAAALVAQSLRASMSGARPAAADLMDALIAEVRRLEGVLTDIAVDPESAEACPCRDRARAALEGR